MVGCGANSPRVVQVVSEPGKDATGSAPVCVPGAQIACACLGGTQGIQACNADGTGYEACQGCDTEIAEPDAGSSEDVAVPDVGPPAEDVAVPDTAPPVEDVGEPDVALPPEDVPVTDVGPVDEPDVAGPPPPTELDLHEAILFDNPVNLADWPITTTITAVEFQYQGGDGVHVEFDKLDGPEKWPDVTPPGWDGPLQFTLGMAEYINGQWYASAAIQFWYGLAASGGNVALDNQIAKNWYYDSRWGEMAGYQPATGEIIGIFVVAGNVRGVKDEGSQSPVKERSNVVLVPMPDVNGATYSF